MFKDGSTPSGRPPTGVRSLLLKLFSRLVLYFSIISVFFFFFFKLLNSIKHLWHVCHVSSANIQPSAIQTTNSFHSLQVINKRKHSSRRHNLPLMANWSDKCSVIRGSELSHRVFVCVCLCVLAELSIWSMIRLGCAWICGSVSLRFLC